MRSASTQSDAYQRYARGLAGEALAARAYAEAGYEVLETRWRSAEGEIDLIVGHTRALVFVEVKTSRSFSRARQRLSAGQIARLQAAALSYCAQTERGFDAEMRFDLACVNAVGEVERVENITLEI